MRRISTGCFVAALALAATFSPAAAEPVSAPQRADVVRELGAMLAADYVLPDVAKEMQAKLDGHLAAGDYDALTDTDAFAARLTEDLRAVSGDMHLRVMFGENLPGQFGGDGPRVVRRVVPGDGAPAPGEGRPVRRVVRGGPEGAPGGEPVIVREVAPPGGDRPGKPGKPGEPVIDVDVDHAPTDGGVFAGGPGIGETRMLPGGIGVIPVTLFKPLGMERERAERAMASVADANALIFDLRRCRGGAPEMVHFLTSYLYGPEPFHLLTYYTANEPPDSAYTLAEVPGRRLPDVPVYVLTSRMTASGGEEFAYNLKHHGRATIVGETTAGGGHGGGVEPVAHGFHAFVPTFRPVHPVTGQGWEGRGVAPDLECSSGQAELRAREAALTVLSKADDSEEQKSALAEVRAELAIADIPFDRAAFTEYGGKYGIRTIFVEDDGLYLQRQGGPRLLLVRRGPDEFELDILPEAKIRFARDDDGVIHELHVFGPRQEWEVTQREAS